MTPSSHSQMASKRMLNALPEQALPVEPEASAPTDVSPDCLAATQARLRGIGCSSILVGTVGPAGVDILASNRPAEWRRIYLERAYHRICPVAREIRRRSRPYTWSEVTSARRIGEAEQQVMDHARHFGLREGLIVPLPRGGEQIAFVSFAGPSVEMNGTVRDALTALARSLHGEFSRVALERPRLTRREAEILQWIANGKSDWQIGQILSISAKTVNYHVENTKRKFAVATRLQAVVRAVQAGQVTV